MIAHQHLALFDHDMCCAVPLVNQLLMEIAAGGMALQLTGQMCQPPSSLLTWWQLFLHPTPTTQVVVAGTKIAAPNTHCSSNYG